MPVAKVGDSEIDYDRGGSAPPLLLIMGLSGTALHWAERAAELICEHAAVPA
jgi:pimeloyl-ACP methyl ester carboxylesterase